MEFWKSASSRPTVYSVFQANNLEENFACFSMLFISLVLLMVYTMSFITLTFPATHHFLPKYLQKHLNGDSAFTPLLVPIQPPYCNQKYFCTQKMYYFITVFIPCLKHFSDFPLFSSTYSLVELQVLSWSECSSFSLFLF